MKSHAREPRMFIALARERPFARNDGNTGQDTKSIGALFMTNIIRRLNAACAVCLLSALPLAAQNYRAPRAPGGHPDFNGIWQALNEANYDVEAHVARPAMALRPGPYGPVPAAQVLALGAVGAVPPS